MSKITETRTFEVKGRVIKLNNLHELAILLAKECSHFENGKLRFRAISSDHSSFTSSDPDLFDSKSVLARKPIIDVKLEFFSYARTSSTPDASIEIQFTHGEPYYGNKIVVSGSDSKWVNGSLNELVELIESFAPQNQGFSKIKELVRAILAISIGLIYFYLFSHINTSPDSKLEVDPEWVTKLGVFVNTYPYVRYILKYSLAYVAGVAPASYFVYKLKQFWPPVEFQIGPEHTQTLKRRRMWFLGIIMFGVFPLLTSLIYDLLKYLIF